MTERNKKNPKNRKQRHWSATIARVQSCKWSTPVNSEGAPQIMRNVGETAGSISSRLTLPKLQFSHIKA